jgi:APA family basic amino acid/polyamine antiporter
MPPLSGIRRRESPGTAALLATGCGTAIASICAFGVFQIERLLGGVWSAGAVFVAGIACFGISRACARLTTVVPSGAGLLAFLARGLGRPTGLALALPYLLLTLFLAGAEATIVGAILARLLPVSPVLGALFFLVGTWIVCRSGLRIGFRAQAFATWALVGSLIVLSLLSVAGAAERGQLAERLLLPVPNAWHFVAGVGQALFLFMGFELITSQAEIVDEPRHLRRALVGSVFVLGAFYAVVSLGFSCIATPVDGDGDVVPQLAVAGQAGGWMATLLVAGLSLLASFTSFNGALLTLSRLTAALAAQGVLPRSLSQIEPRSLVPRAALVVLLALTMAAAALVSFGTMLRPSIFAAAVAAAVVYAGLCWVREFAPFAETGRSTARRCVGFALTAALAGLAVGVLLDAGPALAATVSLLAIVFGASLVASARLRRKPAPAPRTVELIGGPARAQ